MATEIYFPPVDPVWEFDRSCVRFYAVVNRHTVVCLVSAEALFQHFGAQRMAARECIDAFVEARERIETLARLKIEAAGTRTPSEVLLTTRDFEKAPEPDQKEYGHVRIKLAGDAVHNEQLEHLARRATSLLGTEIVHGPSKVTAVWTGMTSRGGLLLYGRLIDEDTQASAANLYTPHELETGAEVSSAMFRLYDELLRAKAAVLMERYQQSEAAGGKS